MDRAGFILVIDPGQLTDPKIFQQANSDLINRIKATHQLPGQEIRIPGDKASQDKAEKLKEGAVDIPEELWNELKNL